MVRVSELLCQPTRPSIGVKHGSIKRIALALNAYKNSVPEILVLQHDREKLDTNERESLRGSSVNIIYNNLIKSDQR